MNGIESTGQAHGKIILFGEHAVVHGTEAVGIALRKGARIKATSTEGPSSLFVQNWNRSICAGDGSREGSALLQLLSTLGVGSEGLHLEGMVDIPSRSGLGSSAALAAAIARAVVGLKNLNVTQDDLFEAVQASEKVFHQNPSGLDAAMALQGGGAVFSRLKGTRPLDVPTLPLLVIHSKDRGDTGQMVEEFSRVLKEDGDEGTRRLKKISELVASGIEALGQHDLISVGKAMTENHELLKSFGVSSPNLNSIVNIALKSGALGAKLTGGGGGGCAIVLTRPRDTMVAGKLKESGFAQVNLQ